MPIKVNISESGKTWKLEVEADRISGKSIADEIDGSMLSADLSGYKLKITGGSDLSGFPMTESVEGIGLKRILLKKGWGMRDTRPGVRIRKTVRGKTIADSTAQLNMKVTHKGQKSLAEIFPDQNKAPEPAVEAPAAA